MSLTIQGLFVTLLGYLFQWSGLQIADAETDTFIKVALAIVGLVVAWYGRVRKGDVTALGMRKPV